MSNPKPQTVTQQASSEPWGPQGNALSIGYNQAYRNLSDPREFFSGRTYADPSPATLSGLGAIENRAAAGSPGLRAAQDESLKTLSGNYLDIAKNPAWGTMVENVRAGVLPGIDSRFISAGRTGSGLHGRAVGEGLGSAIGGLAYQHYGDERNRMAAAGAQAPQLAAADYADPTMLLQAGAQREAIAQQPIDEAMARHDFEQNEAAQRLAQYMAMISGGVHGGTQTTTGPGLPRPDPFTSAAGGLLGGASLIGGTGGFGRDGWLTGLIRSDIRLKKDIKRVGEMDDGTALYKYRYKDDPLGIPHIGVMAQEVAETKPEAVAVTPDGYLAVDYDRLGEYA